MKHLLHPTTGLAGAGMLTTFTALTTLALAQTPAQTPAVNREALVGPWVLVPDPNTLTGRWRGHLIANYYVFKADSTYEQYVEVDSRRDPQTGEQHGAWTLKGDTLKLGRVPYEKYRIVLQNQELALVNSPYAVRDSATGKLRYQECSVVYVRFDSLKPLPTATPTHDCQEAAGLAPRAPMPKAVDLIGTWAAVDSSASQGQPHCKANTSCTVITYDTMFMRADSSMTRSVIEVSPTKPTGQVNGTFIPELQWWVASDTLWFIYGKKGGKVEYRYNSDGTRVRADTVKYPVTMISWEDDGRYLIFYNRAYHRVAAKP